MAKGVAMLMRQCMLSVFFVGCLFATAALAEAHPAQQLVEDTTAELMLAFKEEKEAIEADSNVLRQIVSDKIIRHFDFVRMSKLALGKHWRKATAAQRKEFAIQFRELLLNTYAKAIYNFADAEISYKPVHTEEGDRYVDVVSEVDDGSEPVEVTYRFYDKAGAWKVFNITIEGVSLITNYRSTFSSFIVKNGIDALNADLERRNKLAAAGEAVEDEAT